MNEHQVHKYPTALTRRDPLLGDQQYATDFFQRNAFSPKKGNKSNEPLRKDHISKPTNDEINKLSNEQFAAFSAGSHDRKFKSLIIDAISSADRAIKAILPYGHSEIQKYCSVYFLNKEKLLSFIDPNNRSFFSNSDKNSKKGEKKKMKKKDNSSSDLTEMVPINHLERLEKIVYNKVIPILQNDFQAQKKKSQKLMKKGKDWGNSDLKQGLQLLERLNDKQRIAVDECAQILQKFIVRIMQKQQKMLSKIGRMQEKLEQQIKKTQILSDQSKKWEQYRAKTQKQWNKQKKKMSKYEEFSKQIKLIFTEKDRIDSEASEKECLQDILQQIKRMFNNQERHGKRQKKCDHKPHKETHASCKQEVSKTEQQIKSLKQVVKSLDNQICVLREQCQNMDNKLQLSNEKVYKFESKSKKIIEQNESMNKKLDEMMKEENYKSKLIQQYLRIIAKLEDTLRLSEQNLIKLNEQNDSYLEMIAKHSSQKEDYVRHMMETEERSKEMQQIIAKKQIQIQELVNNLCAKERQIIDNEAVIKKLYKQIQQLYCLLKQKQNALSNSEKSLQLLSKQIKSIKQIDASRQAKSSNRGHQTSVILSKQQNNDKGKIMNIQTLQTIEHFSSPVKSQRVKINNQEISTLSQNLHKIQPQKFENKQIPVIFVNEVDEEAADDLQGPPREDFIPRQVNMQTLAEVLAEAQKNQSAEANYNIDIVDNNKEANRDDFIPAQGNKQSEKEIQKEREEYFSQSLKDQMEPIKMASNIEVNSHSSKSKNGDLEGYIKVQDAPIQTNQDELQKKCKEFRDKVSQQLYVLEAESHKIQQLLDLNTRIGNHFNKLNQKLSQNEQYKTEVLQIKEEMQGLTMMLSMCKRSTLKKLQKIAKTQVLHKEAQQEIERLKHRLDDALIVSQHFSNIQQNSDGSGFTIPDHLQSFFKSNAVEPMKFNQQYFISRFPIKPKPSRDFFTQTDAQAQTINPPNVIAIESEVIIQGTSPIVSLVDDRQEEIDKSFIDELVDISPILPIPVPRLESLQNSDESKEGVIPNSLKEIPVQKDYNPQIPEERAITQIKEINYYDDQIVNVHKTLPQNENQSQSNLQRVPLTPQKHPLDDPVYLKNIMNAPEKQKAEALSSQKSQMVEFHHETEIDEMKQMFTQREQQFSELVVQRQQEIQRLKSIIKTLTKAQEVEEKVSVKNSRNKEPVSREIENLKSENEQLWMFLEKEKSEIERLQILIKQYQLHEQLHKLKSGHHQHASQAADRHSEPVIPHTLFDDNQGFVYAMTPAKKASSDRAQIADFEVRSLSKSQNIQEQQNNELIMDTQKKGHEEGLSPPKQSDSPTKRFNRKSQKFEKEESPRQRRHTSPKLTMQFGWQELVPQYFGEKSKHLEGK